MAEWSGFFDAHKLGDTWDRVYLAEHFASYFSPLIGKGVFAGQSNELQVFQDSPASMSVTVSSGRAWIEGYGYSNTSDLILSVDPADGALGRLDRVVIQWSSQDRQIKAIWKKGTPAVSPVLPELRWDADYKELNLAILNISAGLSAITQAQIQDTRANSDLCGWVTGLIDQVDTSTLFAQWESAYQQYFEAQQKAWETFFESIQQDTGIPVPSTDTKNQVLVVNPQGTGYELTSTPMVGTPTEDTHAANKAYVDSKHFTAMATLTASGWSNNIQTVSVPGVTADITKTDVMASGTPDDENWEAYMESSIRAYAQGNDTVQFKCESPPSVDVKVNILVRRAAE